MKKQVVIIGGGISGLTLLHQLKKKFVGRQDLQFLLLEKGHEVGGPIQTRRLAESLVEAGPNGFLDSKSAMVELIKDLGLESELIQADPAAKLRFVRVGSSLHAFPENPWALLRFAPLTITARLRIFCEFFIRKGANEEETVYEFGERRFGQGFAEYFLDPMVSGIFAGDAKELCLKSAFPDIYAMEQQHGSLFKAFIALKRKQEKNRKGTLCSLKQGMGQLIETLDARYQHNIQKTTEVLGVHRSGEGYVVETIANKYFADHVFVSTPAASSAKILQTLDPNFADLLNRVPYASIVVVAMVFQKKDFGQEPKGFGYLVPGCENSPVLGALFSSNIFPNRCRQDQSLVQVMLGGQRHPNVLNLTDEELKGVAFDQLTELFQVNASPKTFAIFRWPKAIPQYLRGHEKRCRAIKELLSQFPGLDIVANFWGGIGVNDCVQNAKLKVENLKL